MMPSRPRRSDPKKTDDYASIDIGPTGSGNAGLWHTMKYRRNIAVGVLLVLLGLLVTPFILYEWSPTPSHCKLSGTKPPAEPTALPRYHGPSVEFPDRFTLVLNSYKRPQLLQRAVRHYSQCRTVDALRVIWCEDGLPPTRAQAPEYYSDSKEVRYDIVTNSSLNNRFWPLEGLRTEAVLSLDDDIIAPCEVLDELFEVWRRDPWNMAGFYPRLHVLDRDCRYRYLQGFGTLTWHGAYSLVLTKAAMLHRDYLEYYSNHMPGGIREHVDAVHNCEDLAMSLLVGSAQRRPPAFLHSARVLDLGKGLLKVKGISSGKRHGDIRNECLNVFARFYGGELPLVATNISDARAGAAAGAAGGGGVSSGSGSSGRGSLWLRLSPFTDALYSFVTGHI